MNDLAPLARVRGRVAFVALTVAAFVGAIACSGAKRLPSGPPPEYEKPALPPWDAGADKAAAPRAP